MSTIELTIDCPPYYSLYTTCHTHGWKYLAPFEWDDDAHVLRFALFAPNSSVDVAAHQQGRRVHIEMEWRGRLCQEAREYSLTAVRRALGLDADTSELLRVARGVGKRYEHLVHGGVGRMLRSPTLWEDAAKTLFTTNCSWALTEYMAAGLCSAAFVAPAPSGRFPFPAPEVLASLSSEKLRRAAPLGYRASYLRSLAEVFVRDPSLGQIEGNGMDWAGSYAAALKLRGFGPYAASHLAVLAGHYDAIPIDSEVIAYARQHLGTANPRRIQKAYRHWGQFAWWGYKMDRMLRRRNWLGD